MFYLDPDNNRYYAGRAFSYGDYQYNSAAATHELFVTVLGFTPVTVQPQPDPQYYHSVGPDNTGAWASTPVNLDDLKANLVIQEKLSARRLLSLTDWLVIRKEENSTDIPADVVTYRNNVRQTSEDNCELINAAVDIPALETLIETNLLLQYPTPVSGYDY